MKTKRFRKCALMVTILLATSLVAEAQIGKSLIEYAKHKSRSERCSVLEVGTANAGTGQLAFYQKCGFEIDGIDRDFFRRNYPDPIFENGIECRHMVRLRIEL